MKNVIDECVRSKSEFFLRTMTMSMSSPSAAKLNYLLHVSQVFKALLRPFVPLMNIFLELSTPANTRTVHIAFSRAVQERLYNPTIKSICKDVTATINSKHTFVSLSYPFKFQSWTGQAKMEVPLSFEFGGVSTGSGSQVIQPWVALKILLSIIIPAMQREEEFVKVRFESFSHNATSQLWNNGLQEVFQLQPVANFVSEVVGTNTEKYTKLTFILDTLFESTLSRMEAAVHVHSPSPTNDVDGVEAIAMYTTLHMCFDAYISFHFLEDAEGPFLSPPLSRGKLPAGLLIT